MATTLRLIAEQAGVSVRTVTRALKNEPGGSQDTYDHVRQVVNRLGYVPNVAARNLKLQSSNVVGLVTREFPTDAMRREMDMLQDLLEGAGKFLLSGRFPEDPQALRTMLGEWIGVTRQVVFVGCAGRGDFGAVLDELPMTSVLVDCDLNKALHDSVVIERSIGVEQAVRQLIADGCQRIGLCGSGNRSRQMGFDCAVADAVDVEGVRLMTPEDTLTDGERAGDAVMDADLDAVLFETDQLAFGFYRYAARWGIKIPSDLAVVGFDDEPAASFITPPLATVAHPIREVAEAIYDLLISPSHSPRSIRLQTHYEPRESARPGERICA